MEFLLNVDFSKVADSLSEILRDPTANPIASLLLLAVLTMVVLIVVVMAILFIGGSDDDESEYDDDEYWDPDQPEGKQPVAPVAATAPVAVEPERRPRNLAYAVAFWAVVAVVLWVATGVVTTEPTLCTSCHPENPHAKIAKSDPHAGIKCTTCHEPGGTIASVTYMLPPRAIHFVSGIVASGTSESYGPASSGSCARCHGSKIAKTLAFEKQGVRMSHKEPLEAGAECIDCHALKSGAVTSLTVGMSTCIRCHDGETASSDCEKCHYKDVAMAARPDEIASPALARDILGTPDCGGCHSQKACDSCHGMRMPHSQEFMAYGHAREGVIDLWNNSGKTCSKCHYEGRRPCSKCHKRMPSHPSPTWKEAHKYGDPRGCEISCHSPKAYITGRDFCGLCHPPGQKPLPRPESTATPIVQ